jgi:hypothetical protein
MKSKIQNIYIGLGACAGLILLLSFQNCSQKGFEVSTSEMSSGIEIDTDLKTLNRAGIRDCLTYTLDEAGVKVCNDPGIKQVLNSAVLTLEKSEGAFKKISILASGEVYLLRANLSHEVLGQLTPAQLEDIKASIKGAGSVSLYVATRMACLVAGPITTVQMNQGGQFVQIYKRDCNAYGMSLEPESAEAREDLQALIEMMFKYEAQAAALPSKGDPGSVKMCPMIDSAPPRCNLDQIVACKTTIDANGCRLDQCGCEKSEVPECPAEVTGYPSCPAGERSVITTSKDTSGCSHTSQKCVSEEILVCPEVMMAVPICPDGQQPEWLTGNSGMPGCEISYPTCQRGAQTQ